MLQDLPTPAIVLEVPTIHRNLQRLAAFADKHHLKLRPHTKTHKSIRLARLQLEYGATGLTVAKAGEAAVMADATPDILMAYPAVDPHRCTQLARLARNHTIRVAIDSREAADALSLSAKAVGSTIGILVDLDVGLHRTGLQSPQQTLDLAQHVSKQSSLRLDGLFFYPGHIAGPSPEQTDKLHLVNQLLAETLDLWKKHGLSAAVVSGGSTPTAYQSHLIPHMTEFRPGTYIFHDMNGVRGGYATLDDCAARIHATVVSTAVPNQFVLDAGSKTLTSDRCSPAPDSGHGHILEYHEAKIFKLTEEHAQVDATACPRRPKVGERVTVIPNHICPCINLQSQLWWHEDGTLEPIPVDARGRVI